MFVEGALARLGSGRAAAGVLLLLLVVLDLYVGFELVAESAWGLESHVSELRFGPECTHVELT
jgi:hypothetical protein